MHGITTLNSNTVCIESIYNIESIDSLRRSFFLAASSISFCCCHHVYYNFIPLQTNYEKLEKRLVRSFTLLAWVSRAMIALDGAK